MLIIIPVLITIFFIISICVGKKNNSIDIHHFGILYILGNIIIIGLFTFTDILSAKSYIIALLVNWIYSRVMSYLDIIEQKVDIITDNFKDYNK